MLVESSHAQCLCRGGHEAGRQTRSPREGVILNNISMLAGADVNQADMRGITPLGVAVGFNRIAIVEALLEAEADVEKPDGRGNTVLHYAAGGASRQLLGAMNVGRPEEVQRFALQQVSCGGA